METHALDLHISLDLTELLKPDVAKGARYVLGINSDDDKQLIAAYGQFVCKTISESLDDVPNAKVTEATIQPVLDNVLAQEQDGQGINGKEPTASTDEYKTTE